MNELLKTVLKDNHKGHVLQYTETDAAAYLNCLTCGQFVSSWLLASLEPDYELHQAVDSIQAKIDEYFGTEWDAVGFEFDTIEARLDEFYLYDDANADITETCDRYEELLLALDNAQDFFELMNRNIHEFRRGEYPKAGEG